MKILTFDTSLDKTYITLSIDEQMVSDVVIENHDEKYHSAYLIPALVNILKNNSLTMQDIDVIGTNIGPGSFTGIRSCVTVARVMAQQINCPLVGVSSLEILSKINESYKKTIVVLDARKKQFYTAVYENSKELKKPELTSADTVKSMDFENTFVIADKTSCEFLKEFGVNASVYTDLNMDLGKYLNKIVCEKIKRASNEEFVWAKLKPLYLQAPPVTISAKNKSDF